MKTAILAIFLFGLLIFPHEFGHYIAAKKCGVKVNEFAFGMGPTIWKKQRGETLHSIRLFPIGGFCALEGEDGDSDDERAFSNKKPWQKLIVLLAGATMNFVVCFIIMLVVCLVAGSTTTKIDTVTENGPADMAGILSGDKIVQMDDTKIENWTDVGSYISSSNGCEINVVVKRDGELIEIPVTPSITETTDSEGNTVNSYIIGITCKISHNPIYSIGNAFKMTGNMFEAVFLSVKMLFSGEATVNDLTGPVGMVQVVNEAASYSIWSYLILASYISVNLGLFNLFPLPALDGGRVIFVLYSLITGRKVNEKVEGTVHFIGIVLLLTLSLYVCFNDVLRIIK